MIRNYPAELDWVNAQLAKRGPNDKSFLGTFREACLRADSDNCYIIRPSLIKYAEPFSTAQRGSQ